MATTRVPLFECMECGKKFYTVKAAERATFGSSGCPGCGGSDIEEYTGKRKSGRSMTIIRNDKPKINKSVKSKSKKQLKKEWKHKAKHNLYPFNQENENGN